MKINVVWRSPCTRILCCYYDHSYTYHDNYSSVSPVYLHVDAQCIVFTSPFNLKICLVTYLCKETYFQLCYLRNQCFMPLLNIIHEGLLHNYLLYQFNSSAYTIINIKLIQWCVLITLKMSTFSKNG